MKKAVLIINPQAGTCQGMRKAGEIIDCFQKAGYVNTVLFTQKRGDATEFARQYAPDCDLLVCVGGDGTFSETVSGIMNAPCPIPLGYIPAGSRNDLAASLGLPVNLLEAAKVVLAGQPHPLDLGQFNQRYFTYVASFGAFTKASYNTPQDLKNTLGYLAYVLEGIKDLAAIQNVYIRGEADGRAFEGEYIFGAVSNSFSIGGIVRFEPDTVALNDGLLELLLIRTPSNTLELARIIQALHTRQYHDCDNFHFQSARNIVLSINSPDINWTLDGEMVPGEKTVVIQNLSKAYQIIV